MTTNQTSEAKADKVAALLETLHTQVETLTTGEDWTAYLRQAARFHKYSANNVMLIWSQRPDASQVAGYRTWQSLGRQVRKGERGIAILAPSTRKMEDEQTGEKKVVVTGFRVEHVFDIAQTDGDEIADIPRPVLLEGDAPAGLWDRLAKQVAAAGFMLARGDCDGANGFTRWADRVVKVRDDVSPAQACKTLAHELAHVLLGHEHQTGRTVKEVEAESVAFVVCAAAGLASDDYSAPYVAGWSGGDHDTVAATASRVVKVAGQIIGAED